MIKGIAVQPEEVLKAKIFEVRELLLDANIPDNPDIAVMVRHLIDRRDALAGVINKQHEKPIDLRKDGE